MPCGRCTRRVRRPPPGRRTATRSPTSGSPAIRSMSASVSVKACTAPRFSLGDDVGYPPGDDDQPQLRRVRRVLGIAGVRGDDGLDLVLARARRDLDLEPRLAVDLYRYDH